ncbi:hypothetical protein [Veillonella sp. CHU110]|uniref:hypothetical protein n=1 Tax=Veillonella sp. CHU110 TaxID=2490947 RepID=UPI000F8D6A43|nr:hypothetical protein [Veillonella sp. CHU110]
MVNKEDVYVDSDLVSFIEENFSLDYILNKQGWNSDKIIGALCLRTELLALLHRIKEEQDERRYNV